MTEEFDLSKKIKPYHLFDEVDVKEFIRLLKEFRDFEEVQTIHIPLWKLDKLAGDKFR